MEEKLSIIIPVYNDEKYLKRCLDSIINLDYQNLEIILVDDGSTDDSLAIMTDYAAQDERVNKT
nr:glycosyltransferase family 2 protein [Ligilactobacillus aviarius]